MTVDELIITLKRLKKDDPANGKRTVKTEGCDCWGDPVGAEVRPQWSGPDFVLITRDNA